ncbi:MAG TPA: hypothetical protein VJ302_30145 [Blastocatellia bacterium]|nr:hypothetical protein [Blastocatellia bacterium]
MRLTRLIKVLPVGAALELLRSIRSLGSRAPEPEPIDEPFSPPFVAEEDFEPGDPLLFLGDSLYLWRPGGSIPPAFRAKRAIRQGEQVWNDPTRPERSDLEVIGPVWE